MTNLIEIERWEDGIYQLETSDPVVGGPDGIDNLQAKQLANRTRYLKKAIETGQSNLDAHVASDDPHPQYATHADLAEKLAALVAQSPETLDTLSELAKALGNDPNFATTIANQLALKAALDSPVFTGTPKGPTPPQFDNSTKLATMAAVQRALGSASSMKTVGAPVTMDATYAGADVVLYGNTGPFTQVLPAVSTYPSGVGMRFYNASGYPVTIQAAGSDRFSAMGGSVASIVVGAGDSLAISGYLPGNWEVMGGSAALQWSSLFGSLLGANGFQKITGGLIQWGAVTVGASAAAAFTFPVAFPTACRSITVTPIDGGTVTNYRVSVNSITATGGQIINTWSGQAITAYWTAIGH
ncbi:gp53-like domain-containing protein [Burkholderia multivorans]|uniref:gp53-like domain-containing protein n=1 Tax=Burkholderia multivorans TaxID=87883 RepID=UPI001ABBA028|nr:hypothetical protein [Burkholderia multivorans]